MFKPHIYVYTHMYVYMWNILYLDKGKFCHIFFISDSLRHYIELNNPVTKNANIAHNIPFI